MHIRERFKRLNGLFLLFVVAPVALATLYFGFLATDVYVSESKFVVRSPEKPQAPGIGLALAGAAGFSTAGEESYAAKEYLKSRDGLRAINRDNSFMAAYTRDLIWWPERFNPFGENPSFEQLFKYYLNKVKIETDVTTSISTLTVRAYTPEDARRINEQLLRVSEATINSMNERGRADMVRFAEVEVADSKEQARNAGLALAAYRSRRGVVDPELQATAQLEMISKLQDEVIATRAQLNQLREFTPLNPQISSLENRSRTLDSEMQSQMQKLTGREGSLTSNSAEYQRLFLENDFADKQLGASLASLQEARNESRRQQVYVQRISQPNLPDSAIEPRRLRGILATLALGLLAWGIASMLIAGVREHAE